jgi:hypothetical protein
MQYDALYHTHTPPVARVNNKEDNHAKSSRTPGGTLLYPLSSIGHGCRGAHFSLEADPLDLTRPRLCNCSLF